jgi:membrane protein DedA with SNARE-associated domain
LAKSQQLLLVMLLPVVYQPLLLWAFQVHCHLLMLLLVPSPAQVVLTVSGTASAVPDLAVLPLMLPTTVAAAADSLAAVP